MLWELSVLEAARKIRDGEISSVELVGSCIAQITATDEAIGAWAFFDPESALQQAEAKDELRRRGKPTGPLNGVPVGVKDIFDTSDMPTSWGIKAYAGRMPGTSATAVNKLREGGAVILGKTVTTELAFASAGPTRNPHNSDHTSGGSSAGSAAGVAAGHVPAAIGTQTNGSVIRPASFCGTYGFKPTRGIISRGGCLRTSQTLDQVGVMARTLEDTALLADVLAGYDAVDETTYARAKPMMLAGAQAEPPVEPCFAVFDLPYANQLSEATRAGLEELADLLGDRVTRIPAPGSFSDVIKHHRTIHEYEFFQNLGQDPAAAPERIHETLRPVLERAQQISSTDYESALLMVAGAENYFAAFFNDYDAILAPSALGEAPLLSDGAGNPICSTIWTFAGLPCITLPLLAGETNLPAGIQLIGAAEEDDRLLRTAAWLERLVQQPRA